MSSNKQNWQKGAVVTVEGRNMEFVYSRTLDGMAQFIVVDEETHTIGFFQTFVADLQRDGFAQSPSWTFFAPNPEQMATAQNLAASHAGYTVQDWARSGK